MGHVCNYLIEGVRCIVRYFLGADLLCLQDNFGIERYLRHSSVHVIHLGDPVY